VPACGSWDTKFEAAAGNLLAQTGKGLAAAEIQFHIKMTRVAALYFCSTLKSL